MSISGLALSRVSHRAFGALEATYVCVFVCVCVYARMCFRVFFPLALSSSLSLYLRHAHVPAWRVQVCGRLGVLGVGHPLYVFLSAPSGELALVRGQAAASICLVNTAISKAHPPPQQKIAQAGAARAKIASAAESAERIYLPKGRL